MLNFANYIAREPLVVFCMLIETSASLTIMFYPQIFLFPLVSLVDLKTDRYPDTIKELLKHKKSNPHRNLDKSCFLFQLSSPSMESSSPVTGMGDRTGH